MKQAMLKKMFFVLMPLVLLSCELIGLDGEDLETVVDVENFTGLVITTKTKMVLSSPLSTVELQAGLKHRLAVSFKYGAEVGGENTKNVMLIQLLDGDKLVVQGNRFVFEGVSPEGNLQYTSEWELSFVLTPDELSKTKRLELSLISAGKRAGVRDIAYSFNALEEDNGSQEPGGGGQEPGIDNPPEPPAVKSLRVSGNRLEYGAGNAYKTVVLRGVNIGDLYHFKKFNISPPDFNYIAATLNANCVRFAVHPLPYRNEQAQALDCLKENVQKALGAGLFVIIDYHAIGFPNGFEQDSSYDPVISYDSNFDHAKEFWDTISKEFSDGRILFELWNEPTTDTDTSNFAARWDALKTYWEQLIKIIRDNGRTNVIIAGGETWTFDLRGIKGSLISDANTAYAWHIYANHDQNNTTEWERKMDNLNTVRPVLVTEWGFSDKQGDVEYAATADFADKFVSQFLKGKNLHSMAWGYDPFYTPSMLVQGNYYSLGTYGKYVVEYLKSTTQERP